MIFCSHFVSNGVSFRGSIWFPFRCILIIMFKLFVAVCLVVPAVVDFDGGAAAPIASLLLVSRFVFSVVVVFLRGLSII